MLTIRNDKVMDFEILNLILRIHQYYYVFWRQSHLEYLTQQLILGIFCFLPVEIYFNTVF